MVEIFTSDLLLFELARGEDTNPPPQIVRELENKGFIEVIAGRLTLTEAGRIRAQRLAPCEHDLRLQAANCAAGRASICTVGQSPLQVSGGAPVKITT